MIRPALSVSCAFCGAPAAHRHHYTARVDGHKDYLDLRSTIPLCSRCHATEHAAWRTVLVGLDRIDDPLVARVRRTTWTVGRLVDLGRGIDPCDLRGLHDVLVAVQGDVLALALSGEGRP